jgi:hypothetical protein
MAPSCNRLDDASVLDRIFNILQNTIKIIETLEMRYQTWEYKLMDPLYVIDRLSNGLFGRWSIFGAPTSSSFLEWTNLQLSTHTTP